VWCGIHGGPSCIWCFRCWRPYFEAQNQEFYCSKYETMKKWWGLPFPSSTRIYCSSYWKERILLHCSYHILVEYSFVNGIFLPHNCVIKPLGRYEAVLIPDGTVFMFVGGVNGVVLICFSNEAATTSPAHGNSLYIKRKVYISHV